MTDLNKTVTLRYMLFGLVLAVLSNIPFYAWIFRKNWDWFEGFPFGWLGVGMNYMATFFHEIGHTVFMWFFGYPAIPLFDLAHGGGMAWMMSDQQIPILVLVWLGLIYALWFFRGEVTLQITAASLLISNLALAFTPFHRDLFTFMGPGAECLIAGFFLYRALFNLAPRGALERFLNAFFGFGIIIQVFINGYGLLTSRVYRLVYYKQKGSHGFGDFDKIADHIPVLNFEGVVWVWLILNALCLSLPFILYCFQKRKDDEQLY